MRPGARRIDSGIARGKGLEIFVDGEAVAAFEGETVAAALLAAGRRCFRTSRQRGEPRSLYCGIGVCHECRLTIDGKVNVRACVTRVRKGMVVSSSREATS